MKPNTKKKTYCRGDDPDGPRIRVQLGRIELISRLKTCLRIEKTHTFTQYTYPHVHCTYTYTLTRYFTATLCGFLKPEIEAVLSMHA